MNYEVVLNQKNGRLPTNIEVDTVYLGHTEQFLTKNSLNSVSIATVTIGL